MEWLIKLESPWEDGLSIQEGQGGMAGWWALQIAPVSETSLIYILNTFIYLFVTVLSLH